MIGRGAGPREATTNPHGPGTALGPIALAPWQKAFAAYVCGLMAAVYPGPACVLACVVAAAQARGREVAVMLVCLGLGLAVGLGRERTEPVIWPGKRTVHIAGRIESAQTYPGRSLRLIVADAVDLESGQPLPGKILWYWDDPPLVPGTGQGFEARLVLRALAGRTNFGLPGSQTHWTRQGVRLQTFSRGPVEVAWADDPAAGARAGLMSGVRALAPPGNSGAVIMALLFGDKFQLAPAFMDQIRRAGLSHSLALSGMHLALTAGFGVVLAWTLALARPSLLLRWPRQHMAAVLAAPLGLFYLWLGAWTPSLARAAVMLAVMIVHQLRGRVRHTQDSLFVAVAVLVLADPGAAHDVSLQLSVLAVAGIVLFMPVCSPLLSGLSGPGWRTAVHGLALLGAVSLCANTLILPVLAAYFGETSAHLYLNLFWLPVLGFVVIPLSFAGLFVVVAGLPDGLARGLFRLAGLGVEALERGLGFLDRVGWLEATAVLRPDGLGIAGYWILLVAACLLWFRPDLRRAYFFLALGLLLLGSAALGQLAAPRDEVELTVLDTGMSQAVFVRTGSGRTVLIDGGGSWNADYDIGRAIVGPVLSHAHPPAVDGVLLSHVDADHVRGLYHILRAFDVGWFGWSGLVDETVDSPRLLDILRAKEHRTRRFRAGDRIDIDDGLWLEVLHPDPGEGGPSENNTSLVLRLVRRGRGLALIPGDAEKDALERIRGRGTPLGADVLVLPHHGSRSSLDSEFLGQVHAAWAVAACGPNNRFGFPHPRVVEACRAVGAMVMTTAERGAVRFRWTDAGEPSVETARPDSGPGG